MNDPEQPTPRHVLDDLAEIDTTVGPELLIFADTHDEGVTVAAATPDVQLAAELRTVALRAPTVSETSLRMRFVASSRATVRPRISLIV